ncbi:MAG: signal peptidase I [Acidilobaceae archaeon]
MEWELMKTPAFTKKFAIGLLDVILILILVSYIILRLSGGGVAVVSGRSMEPTLHTGDVVIYINSSPKELKEGDVVIYESNGDLVIHRIVYKYEVGSRTCFVIQGDNNPRPDVGDPESCPPTTAYPVYGIPEEWIRGKVVDAGGYVLKVPYIGILTLMLHELLG